MNEKNLPRVSVIVANHNYGRWIADALRSVDAQRDYPYKKIFVVDDGSTDASWDIIQSVANLKLFRHHAVDEPVYSGNIGQTQVFAYRFPKPGGPSRARNKAIRLAWDQTDVFAPLDADDVFLPGKITKSVAKIMSDPVAIGGVYTDYDTFSEATKVLVREYKQPYSREKLLQECVVHSACMVTKPALEKAGGYDENLRVCEDYDLFLRISEHFLILHIPEALMRVRVGTHQSSSTVRNEIWQKCWRRVAEKTQERALRAKNLADSL